MGKKTLGGPTNWKDDWWNDAFNNSIKKLTVMPEKFKKKQKKHVESSSSDESSSEDSSNSSSLPMPGLGMSKQKKKHIKKH